MFLEVLLERIQKKLTALNSFVVVSHFVSRVIESWELTPRNRDVSRKNVERLLTNLDSFPLASFAHVRVNTRKYLWTVNVSACEYGQISFITVMCNGKRN